MIAKVIIAAAALALAGCAGSPLTMPFAHDAPAVQRPAPIPAPVIRTVVKQVCIPWHKWSDPDMEALAKVIARDKMPAIITRALLDWRRYYGDAKACQDGQG